MQKVAMTNYTFESLQLEEEILAPLGCKIVGQACRSEEELAALVGDADYAIIQPPARLTASVIAAMDKCRLIVRNGVGVDNIDLDAATEKGLPVCNIPDYCVDEVADHTMAFILALTRQLLPVCHRVREGAWGVVVPAEKLRVLHELKVGVVGFGRMGRAVAERLKAFKCQVLVFDPGVDDAAIGALGGISVPLEELIATSDVITLHCPSTAQTRHIINRDSLAKMKDGVLIVNSARGDLIETDDLIAGLESGRVGGAALDIAEPEPITKDSPLLGMDSVILTSHLAWASAGATERLRRYTAEAVARAIRGERLLNVVNGIFEPRKAQ